MELPANQLSLDPSLQFGKGALGSAEVIHGDSGCFTVGLWKTT